MNASSHLLREADLPSFVGFLPHHSVDRDGSVVLLADNADALPDTLGMAWRLGMVETEARSDADVGALGSRLEKMLLALPEGVTAQLILRSSRDLRDPLGRWHEAAATDDPVLRELSRARVRAIEGLRIEGLPAIFEARAFEALLTLARTGTWSATSVGSVEAIRAAIAGSTPIESRVADAFLRDRKAFLETAAVIESLAAQAGVATTRLGEDALAADLHRAINPARSRTLPVPEAAPDELMRERVALSSLSGDLDEGIVTIDGLHHKIVSVTKLPQRTTAGMLLRSVESALPVDAASEADWVLNIHVPNQEAVRDRFGARRRLAQDQSRDAHQSPTMAPQLDELVDLEREFASGARVLSLRLHVVVRDSSRDGVAARARSVAAALSAKGFRAVIEDVLAGTLFLSTLPLAYRPDNDRALRRSRQVLAGNAAHLLPVFGSFAGNAQTAQLLLNRRGEPLFLGFFAGKEAPHAIVTGKSGAGKSVFANDLILNAARSGGRVWVLDRGGSYKKLAETLGGIYVAYDARKPPRLNACGLSAADGTCLEEANTFLRDWLTEMATHGKNDLSVRDQSLLSIAVRKAFGARAGREVTLSDLHQALASLAGEHPAARDLAVCLADYVATGPYGRFFDGPNEVAFDAPFVAVDLADAALEDAVTSVLVMALMHGIASVARRWPHQDKYLVIDEAWTLLKSAATARFIENVARTARKIRLSLVVISQQLTDLDGPSGRAILAQTSYKVCLHQDADAIRLATSLLGLTPREAQLYGSLRTVPGSYAELFIKTPTSAGVGRLVIDPLSYWLTTSDPADRRVLDELVEKARGHGMDDRSALREALVEASRLHPRGAPALSRGA